MPLAKTHCDGPWTPAVIVPAHNESARLPTMLRRLYRDGTLVGTRVVVVSNGSTDETAARATETLSSLDAAAVVLDLPTAGKANAIRSAEQTLPPGPRLYLDADAGCEGATAAALLAAVDSDRRGRAPADVAVPRRLIVVEGIRNPLLRSYYRVWQQFPWVQRMPSGRAAYALSWELRERQGPFPDVVADDRWATSLVPREEVAVLDAAVDVHPVPTMAGLLAVRTRVYQGNRQAGPASRAPRAGSQRPAILRAARRPSNWPGLAVFLVVDRLAHRAARRRVTTVWTKR